MKKNWLVPVVALLLVFSMAWPGYASTFQAATSSTQWSSVGPDFNQSTPQYLVTCQMTANNLLYVGTTTAGVWTFDGTTWTQLGGYYGLQGKAASVTSLAMDGNGNVYAGTCGTNGFNGDGVWEWDGESWSQLGGPDGLTGTDADIGCLCYADGTLYAGSNGGVSAASHTAGVFEWDGSSWTLADPITGDNMYPVTSLCYAEGTLYAGTDGLFVYALMPNMSSVTNNPVWWLANRGFGGSYYITSLVEAGGILYAGTTSGLYQFGMGIIDGQIVKGVANGQIVDSSYITWTKVGSISSWINSLADIDGALYVSGGVETLEGTTLSTVGSGFPGYTGVNSLVSFDGDLYAGSTSAGGYGGLYVLKDGTWSPVYIGSTGTVAAVRSLASTGSTLNAGTNADGVWTMGSTSWTQAGSSGQFVNTTEVNSLTYIGSTLYAGTTDGVWTLNNGSWAQVDSSGLTGSAADVNSLADNGGTLYAGSNEGVWTLNGGTWSQVDSSGLTGNAADVTSLAYTNNTLYAGTPDGVWVLNSGSWAQVDSAGLTGNAADVTSLVYANNTIYAGTNGSGVWVLSSGSWAQVDSSGLTGNAADVNSLNASSGALYAGTNNGVWALNGGSWTQVGGYSGLTGVASYVSSLDVFNGTIYAGTEGGVWEYSGSISTTTPLTAIGAIAGTPQVGSMLTAGALTPSGATATYQWESATAGGTYSAISGATSSTYTPVSAYAGDYIEVVATGTGSYSGSATSAAVGSVAGLGFSPAGGTITTSTPIYINAYPALSTNEAVYWNTTGPLPTASDNLYNPNTGFTLSVSGTVYAAVYDYPVRYAVVSGSSLDTPAVFATGSWSDQTSATYTVGSAAISVASQVGTITAGTAGSATFAVTTNIANGTAVSIGWCNASGTAAATPTGLSAAGTDVLNGASTITVTANAAALAGTYYFTATSAGATSGVVTVTVSTYTIISSGGGGGGGGVTSLYPPAVQTVAASTITATSAVLNGDITSDDGFNITDYGFMWGTSEGSLTNKLDVGTNNQSGAYMGTLSNLTTGTTYYFEAYATNSYGTSDDGAVMSFTAGVQALTAPSTPSTPSTPTTGTAFSDVPASFWGYNIITNLATRGIVAGYTDGTFKPNAAITRAEFATMLAKALGLNITNTTTAFTDVAQDSWDYGPVNAAAAAGLVVGYGGTTQFGPYTLITREQMAVMVAKALGTKAPTVNGTELSAFNDASQVSSWALTGVEESVKAGIVIGMSADHLAPLAHATRAQAAAMIYQLLNFLGK